MTLNLSGGLENADSYDLLRGEASWAGWVREASSD